MATPTADLAITSTSLWTNGVGTYSQPVPSAPANLTALAISGSQINLGLTIAPVAATHTEWGYKTTAGAIWTILSTTLASVSSLSVTGLSAGISYDFRARYNALNGYSSYSAIATAATVVAPSVPTIALTVVGSSQINIAMTAFPANATTVNVQRSTSSTFTSPTTLTITSPALSHADTGLSSGITYYYRASATGTGGTSPYNTTLNATTVASGLGPTVVVTGTGFGIKSVAVPLRLRTLINNTNGQAAAGNVFDFGANYYFPPEATWVVDKTQGIGGTSVKLTAPGYVFTHHGENLPNVTYVKWSFWQRIRKLTSNPASSGYSQRKMARIGISSNTGDPALDYHENPKYEHVHLSFSTNNDDQIGLESRWYQSNGFVAPTSYAIAETPRLFSDNAWHFMEGEAVWNTVSASDGLFRTWIDGVLTLNVTGAQPRTAVGQTMQYIQYAPGLTNGLDSNTWEVLESRHYVDTTKASICRINAATEGAATGKFYLRPTLWTDTRIEFDGDVNYPVGYNWYLITNANGSTQVKIA